MHAKPHPPRLCTPLAYVTYLGWLKPQVLAMYSRPSQNWDQDHSEYNNISDQFGIVSKVYCSMYSPQKYKASLDL